ncbi:restriction endonuclease subunit S [Paenibacillus illinoisensis]|uniref:Type I restriction enzyme specificity protein n=1 Tax=Paenibacillus illinoisensis TaxID=59845 RepID=A0A2W0CAY1_9BACL|nr:restriction endonuclease subunit S [Paenibacillus illinoisensis]PYY29766.1 Type I restriction enzyme specificity protein [Paenibacillus illinoisensis]
MGNNYTPEIRFSEFTDAWEQRKLGEMLKEFIIKSKTEDEYTVLSSTNSGMEIRDGRVSGTSNLGYKIIEDGDLVLSPQNLWLGNINVNGIGKGLVSPSYKTFKFVDLDSQFIEPQLRLPRMLEEYKNASTQGASVVRRNLELESFYQIPIRVPSWKEQKKIGSFFKQLDDTITLHQRKLDNVIKLKAGFLQKIFPKNGEDFPEIRFPGFTDAWEQRELREVIKMVGGATPSKANKTYWGGDIVWLSSQEIKERYVSAGTYTITEKAVRESATKVVPAFTPLIVSRSGILARMFPITLPTVDVAINQDIKALFFDKKILDTDFVVSQLEWKEKMILTSIVKTGTTVQSVNMPDFEKLIISIPSIQEQQKIGEAFKKLDYLITLHRRELDALKETKKAFLQKMFI